MAVVQISKIQHRRGVKGNADIPQLASGEIGWAIDAQELYIGNGSVDEGAPYVGNTRILTEHDSIFTLSEQYQYKKESDNIQTGASSAVPVERSIQDRLDEHVTINSFGAVGDGIIDDTDALQRAIDQLFINDSRSINNLVVLDLPPGEFKITNSLKIPPFVNLRGAGKDKTIIKQTGNYPVFVTVSETSTPGNYYTDVTTFTTLNQPRQINISGITFKQTVAGYPVGVLNVVRESYFLNVKFEGIWEIGESISTEEHALRLVAKSSLVTTQDNVFENCDVSSMSYGVYSTYDINSNIFKNCKFNYLGVGVMFGDDVDSTPGKQFGPQNNKFTLCRFDDIDRQGIKIVKGKGNSSVNNKFVSVGNDGGSSAAAITSVIQFDETGNISDNDYFERSVDLTSDPIMITSNPYVSEFAGNVIGNHKFNNALSVTSVLSPTPLFRLGAFGTAEYKVYYVYTSSVAGVIRRGTLSIIVDKILNTVVLDDDYSISGTEANAEKLQFSAALVDVDGDTVKETVNVNYTNSTVSDTGTFKYWYEVIS